MNGTFKLVTFESLGAVPIHLPL